MHLLICSNLIYKIILGIWTDYHIEPIQCNLIIKFPDFRRGYFCPKVDLSFRSTSSLKFILRICLKLTRVILEKPSRRSKRRYAAARQIAKYGAVETIIWDLVLYPGAHHYAAEIDLTPDCVSPCKWEKFNDLCGRRNSLRRRTI